MHRLHRGDVMQPREAVAPGVIEGARRRRSSWNASASDAARRKALADWIADPQNPLTARVLVNRLWHYHFGRGLVATPSNFGFLGGQPTHPELLDWLAAELIHRAVEHQGDAPRDRDVGDLPPVERRQPGIAPC